MTRTSYAIVGGGIVGASVAYHLSERGADDVTVYERAGLASATTAKSTAMIGVAGPEPVRRLKAYGFRLYNDFFADPAADPSYVHTGRLRVATTEDSAAAFERLVADDPDRDGDGERAGLQPSRFEHTLREYVPGESLHDRFLLPPLETALVEGALYQPEYGYVTSETSTLGPQALAFEFVERARDGGVTFRTGTTVTAVRTEGSRATGIETAEDGFVAADEVICAAGPWTEPLLEGAGLELPVDRVPSPVFALTLEQPLSYTLPAIKHHESSVGIHPKRDETILLTYTPDDAAARDAFERSDPTPSETHRQRALEAATRLVPILEEATITDEWLGFGTRTPDGRPLAGWTSIDGLSLAVTPAGIQLGPAVGSIVARQVLEDDPTRHYDTVSIARFDGYSDWRRER
ncbi:FAD-binding oxidoreductase [Salinadaptatus halalkaliphilus]|uniref:FAD-binding oxidoreductase n=1 Tax=Salinadaptatus halalkaliphilus TaxID=2419781 RepID=A0A4S3TIL6_9EURY|nr:FAD-binding oxidoreductase [Salinadaptatus halalkaliphilus]THE63792.1 FAD-binding oxidoreductase [Salinadaptatus halalkaliphilus]